MDRLKILAVEDPAVKAYVDEGLGLLRGFSGKADIDVLPWSQYYERMMDACKGNGSYDIFMVAGHLWKRDFAEKGFLAPVPFDREDILPVIADEMKYDGRYYLSPSFCDGHMVVYRKSVLKKVLGILPGVIMSAWEYGQIAEKLNKAGFKIAVKADKSEIFTDALPFLRMYGQDVYSMEGGRIQCARDEVVRGLEQYIRLKGFAFEDSYTFGNEEVAGLLKSGKAAMGVTWSGQMGVVCDELCTDKEDLGFACFATGWNVTWSFGISAGCGQKERAGELLRFLRSGEIDREAGRVSGAPVRKSSYVKGLKDYPWYGCQLDMIRLARPIPDLLSAGEKNNALYREIFLAFTGRKTPRKAMEDAQLEIKKWEVQGGTKCGVL